MTRRSKDTIRKAAIVAAGVAMIASLAILTSARIQSRFVESQSGSALVFIDKYVDEPLRAEFTAGIDSYTGGFLKAAGLLGEAPIRGPVAFFAADRHYGVISANDPLVKRRLSGRPSSDFVLFRSIGSNFYANELVARSIASQDGAYVFVNIDEGWRASLVHAYAHSIAAANAPAALSPAFVLDQDFDSEMKFSYRFADETFALLASDLLELAEDLGSVEQAWSSFSAATARRYADPESDVAAREAEIIMATYDLPQKSAEFYAACNGFASWLLDAYGRDALCAAARTFFSGRYDGLDDPFIAFGGLEKAVLEWNGDATIPR